MCLCAELLLESSEAALRRLEPGFQRSNLTAEVRRLGFDCIDLLTDSADLRTQALLLRASFSNTPLTRRACGRQPCRGRGEHASCEYHSELRAKTHEDRQRMRRAPTQFRV